jgi:phage terminase small subunit
MLLEQAFRARDVEDEARAERLRGGLTIESKRSRVKHINPVCQVEKDARSAFLAAWRQLGLAWDVHVDGHYPER